MSNEISENLFQAIDIITSQRLAGLQYDKTLICTIEDASKAETGEYTVSDTSSRFQAFSENTKYTKGTRVYVSVPNGDMNNQKMITGKCVSGDSTPYTYMAPFESFIDISGNIAADAKAGALLANKYYDIDTNNMTQSERGQEIILWTQNLKPGAGYTAYDRMGISADFLTTVYGLGAVAGHYGLRLDMTVGIYESEGSQTFENYSFYLSSADCYGNPYNYGVYTKQEKMFDVSSILGKETNETSNRIREVRYLGLVFYQDNDFCTNSNAVIPYKMENGKLLPNNLKVKNISINFGYDLSNYSTDQIILGSTNGLTYAPSSESEKAKADYQWALSNEGYAEAAYNLALNEYNQVKATYDSLSKEEKAAYKSTYDQALLDYQAAYQAKERATRTKTEKYNIFAKIGGTEKNLYMRFAHLDESGKVQAITSQASLEKVFGSDAAVHWYRYKLDNYTTNELAGKFWTEIISSPDTVENHVNDESTIDHNHQYNGLYAENDELYNTKKYEARSFYENNKTWNAPLTNKFSYTFYPNITVQKEYIKIIIEVPSKQSIIKDITGSDNIDIDNIKRYFNQISVKNHNGVTDNFLNEMYNLIYIGTEKSYTDFEAKYAIRKEATNAEDRYGNPFYISGEEFGEIKTEPNKDSYTSDEKYERDLKFFKDYQRRMENRKYFEKLKTLVMEKINSIQYFTSDTLTFNNEVTCINPDDVDLISGLEIECDPKSEGGYGGQYLIYNSLNHTLINSADSSKRRQLIAKFKSLVTGTETLDQASTITWYIPEENTMIKKPEAGNEYNDYKNNYEKAVEEYNTAVEKNGVDSAEATSAKKKIISVLRGMQLIKPELAGEWDPYTAKITKEGLAIIDKIYDETVPRHENGYWIITRTGSEIYDTAHAGDNLQINNTQTFRIKEYYQENAVNNTVKCVVTRGGRTYEASVDLTFGVSGNSGTNATFILQLQNEKGDILNYIPWDKNNDQYFYIKPLLFNYKNEQVNLTNYSITFSWYCMSPKDQKTLWKIVNAKNDREDCETNLKCLRRAINECQKAFGWKDLSDTEELEYVKANYLKIYESYLALVQQKAEEEEKVAKLTTDISNWEKSIEYTIGFVTGTNDTPTKSVTIKGHNARAKIKVLKQPAITNYAHAIVQAQIPGYTATIVKSNNENTERVVDLTAFLPLASADASSEVSYAALPSSIIFNSKGSGADSAEYYKDEFTLYKRNGIKIKIDREETGTTLEDKTKETVERWGYLIQETIEENGYSKKFYYKNQSTEKNSVLKYYPALTKTNKGGFIKISPQKMFVKEATGDGKGYSLFAEHNGEIVWVQPILIIQNKYGSPMLNNWDGELSIDKDGNTIMSAMVGAGIKNSDNSFSGLLMGVVESKTGLSLSETSISESSKLGLYGFDKGIQSFGFRADGTGFLGAAGKGQIKFDGNSGYIKSGNYEIGKNGLLLNFNGGLSPWTDDNDGASIAVYGSFDGGIFTGNRIYQGVELDPTRDNIFRIFSTTNNNSAQKDILKIGRSEYFLQTLNYSSGDKTGTRIDLANGKMDAYNFTIRAYNKNNEIKIDSTDDNGGYPLQIGPINGTKPFKVAWDGSIRLGAGTTIIWGEGGVTQEGENPALAPIKDIQKEMAEFKDWQEDYSKNEATRVRDYFASESPLNPNHQSWADGFYSEEVTENGKTYTKLFIKAETIRTGLLDANMIKLANGYGGFCYGEGLASSGIITHGIKMYSSNASDLKDYLLGNKSINDLEANARRYIIMTQDTLRDDGTVLTTGGIRVEGGDENGFCHLLLTSANATLNSSLNGSSTLTSGYYVANSANNNYGNNTAGTSAFIQAGKKQAAMQVTDGKVMLGATNGYISQSADAWWDVLVRKQSYQDEEYRNITLQDGTKVILNSSNYAQNDPNGAEHITEEAPTPYKIFQNTINEYQSRLNAGETLDQYSNWDLNRKKLDLSDFNTYGVRIRTIYPKGILMGITQYEERNISHGMTIVPGSVNEIKIFTNSTSLSLKSGEKSEIVASQQISTGSDRRLKKKISSNFNKYEIFFNNLKPVSYEFRTNDSQKHLGFIAQEVEEALQKAKLKNSDFGGLNKPESEEEMRTLAYGEFIALNTHMIQKLQEQVRELKQEIKKLKGEN